jgi:hypothetical protein
MSRKLPGKDSFLYYAIVLVLAFLTLVGMLMLATRDLWQ